MLLRLMNRSRRRLNPRRHSEDGDVAACARANRPSVAACAIEPTFHVAHARDRLASKLCNRQSLRSSRQARRWAASAMTGATVTVGAGMVGTITPG
jgi:hypothetical protein